MIPAKDTAKLLFEKYKLLKEEIFMHVGNYKRHVRYIQLFGAAVLALASFLGVKGNDLGASLDSFLSLGFVAVIILFLFVVFAYYLVFDVMEPMFSVVVLACRMAMIEEELNRLIGKRIFIWESHAAKILFSAIPVSGTFQPHLIVMLSSAVIVFTVALALPLFILYSLYEKFPSNISLRIGIIALGLLCVGLFALAVHSAYNISSKLRGKISAKLDEIVKQPFIGASGKRKTVSQT